MTESLSPDTLTRLREIADKSPELCDVADLDFVHHKLPALLADRDAAVLDADLQRESSMAADARARRAEAQRVALAETVRDVAESLDAAGVSFATLAAQTLTGACDQAGGSTDG